MQVSRALVVALLGSGCAEVGVQHCADGSVCPAGSVCVAPAGCASPGDCGDRVISGDERCDDGNRISGDGCAADCRSEERCGDGVPEPGFEECDDGNLASHDGCSSGCLLEMPVWREQPGAGPSGRIYGASTWDPARGRGVLHGGGVGYPVVAETQRNADTWWWTGSWTQGPTTPEAIWSHAMAEDRRGRVVMFGGERSDGECAAPVTTVCNACSVLDGDAWTACAGPLPPGRMAAAMGPNSGGGVLLHGGISGLSMPSEELAWIWRDGVWAPASGGATTPRTRNYGYLVHHPRRELTYLLGGTGTLPPVESFEWDGARWQSLQRSVNRFAGGLAFDPARQKMVVFGGQPVNSATLPGNTLEGLPEGNFDDLTVTPGPAGRYGHAQFYDPIRHALVVFGGGGTGGSGQVVLGDTWLLRWESATPDEQCDGSDADGDGRIGCDDEDCWARCKPFCPPRSTCDGALPHCGDGTCNASLEDPALCPADC